MATCRECLHFYVCRLKNNVVCTLKDAIYKEYQALPNIEDVCGEFVRESNYVKRERGEWVVGTYKTSNSKFMKCSNCKSVIDLKLNTAIDENEFDFCPYCNADMRRKIIMGKWISVKDRLPEFSGDVLVCYRTGESCRNFMRNEVCYYADGKFTKCDGCITYTTATHWQPLPEPPELLKGGVDNG